MSSSSSIIFALVLVLAFAGYAVEGVKYFDCFLGRGHAIAEHIEVDSCGDSKSCICNLKEGRNATVSLKFKPLEDYKGIHYFVDSFHGLGFERLAGGDACQLPGFQCPGKHNKSEDITIHFPVKASTKPTLALFVLLYREDRQPLVCQTFPVNICKKKSLADLLLAAEF